MPTATPTLTRENLFFCVEINDQGRAALTGRFKPFIVAEHVKRGDYVTPHFINTRVESLIRMVINTLGWEAKREFDNRFSPDWSSEDPNFQELLLNAEENAEDWYRWMLKTGNIKLPKRRHPISADNMNLAA